MQTAVSPGLVQGLAPAVLKPPAVTGKVTVKHVPETVTPEPPKARAEPGAPGADGEWAEAPAGEPLVMTAEDWADLYGMPPEAVSLWLKAPELNFSDETCKLQGERISRYCIRHNIVLPPFLDIVPIVSRLAGDYMKLAKDAAALMKKREVVKGEKPPKSAEKEIKIPPESTVEHVAAAPELPDDFDAGAALKAATTPHKAGGP